MKKYIRASKTLEDYEAMGIFDEEQLDEIRKGLKQGLDVSWYADPKFNHWQMQAIRSGLYHGVDVSLYADPEFNHLQMAEIRLGLNDGLDVSPYADPKFNNGQMFEIRQGIILGLDVAQYANPKFDRWQMQEIRKQLQGKPAAAAPKQFTWKSLLDKLAEEGENRLDSLDAHTDAGEFLQGIQLEVEDSLGILLEPSVQAGMGGIWFYSSKDDSTLVSNYDYQTFNDETIELAFESKNKSDYKKKYKKYLQNILAEYGETE